MLESEDTSPGSQREQCPDWWHHDDDTTPLRGKSGRAKLRGFFGGTKPRMDQRDTETVNDPVHGLISEGAKAYGEGRLDHAQALFSQACRLRPYAMHGHMNLGVVLRKQGKLQAALTAYARALALAPDDPALNSNLGNALREAGYLDQARRHIAHALATHRARLTAGQPEDSSYAYNLALVTRDLHRSAEARQMLAALVQAAPDNAEYRWDLSLTDLYLKDYTRGFAGYEARWGLARTPKRDHAGPQWTLGETGSLKGKTVLITAEQGFGDALQFARFLPLVAQTGARVVVECLPELIDLFQSVDGIAAVVAKGAALPPYDLWAPMMSLAHLLGVTWQDLPAPAAYLRPPGRLKGPLPRPPGNRLNVGLIWAGKLTPRDRSWPLDKLLPLMSDPSVAFWSLQLGPRADDLNSMGVTSLINDLSPHMTSFGATAILMSEMDLIITIDTSAAHLAGALGRPTWVLLRYVSDWRWLDEGDGCAWYPTMRLFRQSHPFDFDGPVVAMKQALDQLVAARPRA